MVQFTYIDMYGDVNSELLSVEHFLLFMQVGLFDECKFVELLSFIDDNMLSLYNARVQSWNDFREVL